MHFGSSQKNILQREINGLLKEMTLPEPGKAIGDIPGVIAGITDKKSNLYLNSKGISNIQTKEKISTEHVVSYFSCTKVITCMAALQLYENGKLDLDAPAKNYIPEIDYIGLIPPGLVNKEDGSFTVPPRKPKNYITCRQLMNHTAGFSYGFLSEDYRTLHKFNNSETHSLNPSPKFFSTIYMPLLHEPGTKWAYGHNSDWLGLIIEKISGMKLNKYIKKNIFDPIGMNSCTFHPKKVSMVKICYRKSDGSLVVPRKSPVTYDSPIDMGGHGCFGTVSDFLKLIRVILNFGHSPDTGNRVLLESTLKFATKNSLPEGISAGWEFLKAIFPDQGDDLFSLIGCAISAERSLNGRPGGVLYWLGLGNLYFWIDLKNGIGGFWATQILPFLDASSVLGYLAMETKTYEVLEAAEKLKRENFSKF